MKDNLILLDSNTIIYAISPDYQNVRDCMSQFKWCASKISIMEVLGYHKITSLEKELFYALFNKIDFYDIDDSIIQKATKLRQNKKMSLGDAIISATAMIHHLPLMTRNSSDFDWIDNLQLINPFD